MPIPTHPSAPTPPFFTPRALERAVNTARLRHRDVPLESALQALALLDAPKAAPESFAALPRPSRFDHRWFGHLLLALERPEDAWTHLMHGDPAPLDAGHTLDRLRTALRLEQLDAAQEQHLALPAALPEALRLAAQLSEAELRLHEGQLGAARRTLSALGAPPWPRAIRGEAHRLWAALHSEEGDLVRAADHLELAHSGASEAARPALHGALRRALLEGGRALDVPIHKNSEDAPLESAWRAVQGGALFDAAHFAQIAALRSARAGRRRAERDALRVLAPSQAALGRAPGAALERLVALERSPLEALHSRLTGQLSRPEAQRDAVALQELSVAFEALGAWGDAVCAGGVALGALEAQGHAAPAERLGDALRARHAERAQRRPLARVVAWCPALTRWLERHLSAALPGRAATLELRSLGEERLSYGGVAVAVPMRRTHEFVTYLRVRGEATLQEILRDVFEGVSVPRARNHLHQLRHLLGLSAVPLSVAYDAPRKTYRLETPLELLWDVELVRGGVLERLGREFMPYCGSQWPAQLEAEVLGG